MRSVMVRLNIQNMKGFLETVNACEGKVNLILGDGRKRNINKRYSVQKELQRKYKENKNYLPLSLEVPTPGDYMRIVCFSIGNW